VEVAPPNNIKFYKNAYGCITCNNGDEIYFSTENLKNVNQSLSAGQRVAFELIDDGTNKVPRKIYVISCSDEHQNLDEIGLSKSNSKISDGEIIIPVVELFDESGEKLLFELLDTIEYKGEKYTLLTPYFDGQDEYELIDEHPADVFVMKEISGNDGEPLLETVENEITLQSVYDIFKNMHEDEFDFK